jgi:hypothetical protein
MNHSGVFPRRGVANAHPLFESSQPVLRLSLISTGHADMDLMALANGHGSGDSSRFEGGFLGAVLAANLTIV